MTKMIQLPVSGQDQQLPNLTETECCSGESFTMSNPPQAASTPTGTVQKSRTKEDVQGTDAQKPPPKNRRFTRRSTSVRSDGVPSFISASSTSSSLSTSLSSTSFDSELYAIETSSFKVPSASESSAGSGIICRLPLDRLESILDVLDIAKHCPSVAAIHHRPAGAVSRESRESTPVAEIGSIPSSTGQQATATEPDDHDDYSSLYKLYCLYCDRTFSNQKLMFKHTDRVHKLSKERRSSTRVVSTVNIADISLCCTFCHKGKTLKPSTEDLPQLFKHYIERHSDRYYACERCVLRFPCEEARESHMEALHPAANNARPKSKAALKSFSHSRSSSTFHSMHHTSSSGNGNKHLNKHSSTSMATEPPTSPVEFGTKLNKASQNRTANHSSERDKNASTEFVAGTTGHTVRLRSSQRTGGGQLGRESRGDGKGKMKTVAFKKSERLLMRNAEPMLLSRLGIAQHRLPRQSRRLLAIASSCAKSGDALSTSSTSSSSSTSASSVGVPGRTGSRKKSTPTNAGHGGDTQQEESGYSKSAKPKLVRSAGNSMPSTANPDAGGSGVGSTNQTTDPTTGRSKGNEFPATATTSGQVGVSGVCFVQGTNNAGSTSRHVVSGGSEATANSGSVASGNSAIGNVNSNNSSSGTSGNNCGVGVFDKSFYKNVSRNVNINLSCNLDGKLPTSSVNPAAGPSSVERSTVVTDSSPLSLDCKIHEATNLPAPGVMFPTLLTVEQYGTDAVVGGLPSVTASAVKTKKPITRNSWKWKWDFVKKYKYVSENGRIVKKIKQPTLGLRDLSKLDMWTQLTMRMKHEVIRNRSETLNDIVQRVSSLVAVDGAGDHREVAAGEGSAFSREDKRAMVEQLEHILDARLRPQIDLEQNDQRIIKVEQLDDKPLAVTKAGETYDSVASGTSAVDQGSVSSFLIPWASSSSSSSGGDNCFTLPGTAMDQEQNFLRGLQLVKLARPTNVRPVVLSGEWARPRCYICYGCGDMFKSLKQVEEHRIFRHPHVYSTFYEIVGRELIEKRLYQHLFIPFAALAAHRLHYLRLAESTPVLEDAVPHTDGSYGMNMEIKNEDSSSNEATSFSTTTSASSSRYSSFSSSVTALDTLLDASADCVTSLTRYPAPLGEEDGESQTTTVCSKCRKECQNMLVLYAHMLHCSNDYVWLQAKKRMKYRRARRRRGGNRNTSGPGGGISCAASLLAIVRKTQLQQQQQSAVEKVETASTSSSASSSTKVDESCSGSSVADSSNTTSGSSASSSNSDGVTHSALSGFKKKSKSPKPKDSDSDIVERLLANLPAKRHSRQIILQSSKQIGRRTNVKGRSPLVASSSSTGASKGGGTTLKCRHTVAGPSNASARMISAKEAANSTTTGSASAKSAGARRKLDTLSPAGASSSRSSLSAKQTNKSATSMADSRDSRTPSGNSVGKKKVNETAGGITRRAFIRKQLRKEIGGEKKILQWKKTSSQYRWRVNATGNRMLRSGCSREPSSVPGRKSQPSAKASMRSNKRMAMAERRRRAVRKKISTEVVPPVSTGEGTPAIVQDGSADVQPVAVVDGSSLEDIPCEPEVQKIIGSDGIKTLSNDGDEPHTESLVEVGNLENVRDTTEEVAKETNVGQTSVPLEQTSACDAGAKEETIDRLEDKPRSCDHEGIDLDKDTELQPPVPDEIESCKRSPEPLLANEVTPPHSVQKPDISKSDPLAADSDKERLEVLPTASPSSSILNHGPHGRSPLDSSSSESPSSKRKPRKLNDCIAMLTGKLSERLGVDFFNSQSQRKASSMAVDKPSRLVAEKEPKVTSSNPVLLAAVPSQAQPVPPPVETATKLPTTAPPYCPAVNQTVTLVPPVHTPISPPLPSAYDDSPRVPMTTVVGVVPFVPAAQMRAPPLLVKVDQQNAPQKAPLPLLVNSRSMSPEVVRTSAQPQPVALPSSSVCTPQVVVDEGVSDEPLNLSKNCVGQKGRPSVSLREHRDVYKPNLNPMHSQLYPQGQQYFPTLPNSGSSLELQKHPYPQHAQSGALNHNLSRNAPPGGGTMAMNCGAMGQPMMASNSRMSCTISPKVGSGNLSSIKLPPGLIIERVEYKHLRPIVSKEAPSVTIVARQRQVHPTPSDGPGTDNRKLGPAGPLPSDALGGLTVTPYGHSHSFSDAPPQGMQGAMAHYCSSKHSRKASGEYGSVGGHTVGSSVTADQLSTHTRVPPAERPTQTVVPFVENRISVTIMEANPPERLLDCSLPVRNNAASTSCSLPPPPPPPQPPTQPVHESERAVPSFYSPTKPQQAMLSPTQPQQSVAKLAPFRQQQLPNKTSNVQMGREKPQLTTLIIPHVPMPPTAAQVPPATPKRARRKSVFVSPPPTTDNTTSTPIPAFGGLDGKAKAGGSQIEALQSILAPAPSSFPQKFGSLCTANMFESMSFSFLPPSLLAGGPPLGLDLQRLAAFGLPAHLKPPVIPPLTVPGTNVPSSGMLDKIQPSRRDALTTALEQSLKRALPRPAGHVAPNEPGSLFDHQAPDIAFVQDGFDGLSAAPASQQSPIVSGLPHAVVRGEETRASVVKPVGGGGKGGRSSTGSRSTKTTSLGDYQRKTLMEQIWNASIVDAMMEKDAIAEEMRKPDKNKAEPRNNATVDKKVADGTVVEKLPVSLVERNASSGSTVGGGSGETQSRPEAHAIEGVMSADKSKQLDPLNASTTVEEPQQQAQCERLQEQKQSPREQQRIQSEEKNEDKHELHHGALDQAKSVLPAPEQSLPLVVSADACCDLKRKQETQPVEASKDESKEEGSGSTKEAEESNDQKFHERKEPDSLPEKSDPLVNGPAACDAMSVPQESSSAVEKLNDRAAVTTPKVIRKRRKNELASILSDQLLESFKEVDKSRLNDLKLLHDITCETPDVKFTLEQIPQLAKRKSNPRMLELVPQSVPSESAKSSGSCTNKKGTSKKLPKETADENTAHPEKEKVAASGETPANDQEGGDQTIAAGSKKKQNQETIVPKDGTVAKQQSAKQLSFVPTRRTRKLSIDFDLVRPLVDRTEQMSQKLLSQRNLGLDIAMPNMKKVPAGKGGPKSKPGAHKAHALANVTEEKSSKDKRSELLAATEPVVDGNGLQGSNIQKRLRSKAPLVSEGKNNESLVSPPNSDGKPNQVAKDRKSANGKNAKQQPSAEAACVEVPATEKVTSGLLPSLEEDKMRDTISQVTQAMLSPIPTAVSNPLKRERRKSVYVDRNMDKYMDRCDGAQDHRLQALSSSSKDDSVVSLRRGTRSLAKTDLCTAVDSLVEATMNPRDPRRRIVRKRIEEERVAAVTAIELNSKEKETPPVQSRESADALRTETKSNSTNVTPIVTPAASTVANEKAPPMRRISTRRASVFVRSPTPPPPPATSSTSSSTTAPTERATDTAKTNSGLKEDANLRTIGNETKRIYRRRASIYTAPTEMLQLEQEEDDFGDGKHGRKQNNSSPASIRRPKTSMSGSLNRFSRLPLNADAEPVIESILLKAVNADCGQVADVKNGPKRRTTKNSQIAETVSKLFNIQEEIMLIDSTRRKPRKLTSTPALLTALPLPEASLESPTDQPDRSTSLTMPTVEHTCMTTNDFHQATDSSLPTPTPPSRTPFCISNESKAPKATTTTVRVDNNSHNAPDSDLSNDSEDDNMSLACFMVRKNSQGAQQRQSTGGGLLGKPSPSDADGAMAEMFIPVRAMSVADDESATNTDVMDDDLMSVTTEMAPSNSNLFGKKARRKRRQFARGSKLKRLQAKAKAESETKQLVMYNCDLCRKVFKKHDAFNKHRMTLSHIAKLSEQEYIQFQQKQHQAQLPTTNVQNLTQAADGTVQPEKLQQTDANGDLHFCGKEREVAHSPPATQANASADAAIVPVAAAPMKLTFPQTEAAGASPPSDRKHADKHSVKVLSQEEKLFFECCSMLKESNTSEGDQLNLTVSLKSNEIGDQQSVPTIILPVASKFGTTECPPLPIDRHPSYTGQTTFADAEAIDTVPLDRSAQQGTKGASFHKELTTEDICFCPFRDVGDGEGQPAQQHRYVEAGRSVKFFEVENYGNVSPQYSTKSSSTSSSSNAKIKTKGALKGYDNFKVSIPMTGLIMSVNNGGVAPDSRGVGSDIATTVKESRLDTLADVALCGDIPKEFGVLGQYEHHHTAGDRITGNETLCNVAPSAPQCSVESLVDLKANSATAASAVVNLNEGRAVELPSDGTSSQEPQGSRVSKMIDTVESCLAVSATKNHRAARTHKNPPTTTAASTLMSRNRQTKTIVHQKVATSGNGTIRTSPDDDVYAFEDSQSDDALPASYSSKKSTLAHDTTAPVEGVVHPQPQRYIQQKQKHHPEPAQQQQQQQQPTQQDRQQYAAQKGASSSNKPPSPADGEDSQFSSLSFSDRDDFVYGTNTLSDEDEEEDEYKSSSNCSGQTTPKKKPIKADVQKKSLIMGRIFKKGGKREKGREQSSATARSSTVAALASSAGAKASVAVPLAADASAKTKDFDKLFDTLKNAAATAAELESGEALHAVACDTDESPAGGRRRRHAETTSSEEETVDGDAEGKPARDTEPTKAAGPGRLRRRSTVVQKKLTETWDSDEYEDFHADAIIGLIDQADHDAARPNAEPNENETDPKKPVGGMPYIVDLSLNAHLGRRKEDQVVVVKHHPTGAIDPVLPPLMDNKQQPSTIDVVVTDDTIRKVMESVILETMVKGGSSHKGGALTASNKDRRSSQLHAAAASVSYKLPNRSSRSAATAHAADTAGRSDLAYDPVDACGPKALPLPSPNDHVLESSVVISSRTITTKFKQKLNSAMRDGSSSVSRGGSSTTTIEDSRADGSHCTKEKLNEPVKGTTFSTVSDGGEGGGASKSLTNSLSNNNNNIHNNNNNNNNNHSSKTNKTAGHQSTGSLDRSKLETGKLGTARAPGGRPAKEGSFASAKTIAGRGRAQVALTAAASTTTTTNTATTTTTTTTTTSSKRRKSVQRKMKNVAYDPDSDYEHSIKYKKVKRKLLESDIEGNLKIEQLQSTLNAESGILLSTPRRKRNAGDMLYYWSSSSEEEEFRGGRSRLANVEEDDEEEEFGREPPNRSQHHHHHHHDHHDHHEHVLKNGEGRSDGKKRCAARKLRTKESDHRTDDFSLADSAAGNPMRAASSVQRKQPSSGVVLDPFNAAGHPSGKSQQIETADSKSKQYATKPSSPDDSGDFDDAAVASVGHAKDKWASGKKVRGRRQGQPQHQQQHQQQQSQGKVKLGNDSAGAADTGSNCENMQQHGWIVGDSHKKLVTLLAHAKGKQDNRKATNSRRK